MSLSRIFIVERLKGCAALLAGHLGPCVCNKMRSLFLKGQLGSHVRNKKWSFSQLGQLGPCVRGITFCILQLYPSNIIDISNASWTREAQSKMLRKSQNVPTKTVLRPNNPGCRAAECIIYIHIVMNIYFNRPTQQLNLRRYKKN